jgi:type IV pilus assembly protein PilC
MPVYQYKAIDETGKFVTGNVDAANIGDLELRLDKMGLDLVNCRAQQTGRPGFGRTRIKRQDLINFCFHLEQLTSSGVPILEGLADLRDSDENEKFRDIVAGLIEAIEGGATFSEALRMYPSVFDDVFVNLMVVGERSGQMSAVLRDTTETLKWQDELAALARKIMMYPAVVGTVVGGVVIFMMIAVVPDVMIAVQSMGGEIPLQTRALMVVSSFVVEFWFLVLLMPVIAFIVIKVGVKKSARFRYNYDNLLLNLPVFGPIVRKIKLARFARYFGLMYGAGITVLDAIEMSRKVVGSAVLDDALQRVHTQISEGGSISESFRNMGVFPPLVTRMLRIGETGGGIDTALKNVAYFYEREVKEAIDKLQPLIESGLVFVLGGIVLWLAFAVLGPIYDLIGTIGAV